MGKEGSALATLATSLNAGPRSDQPGVRPSEGPPWPSTGASSFLAFRACHSPFSELGRHDGRGGRKLASKARRRRALTVVYPPRNKSPLTTSLLSNWPSTQSEGWRSGSIYPLIEYRLASCCGQCRRRPPRACRRWAWQRTGRQPVCVGRQQCLVLNHSDHGIAP